MLLHVDFRGMALHKLGLGDGRDQFVDFFLQFLEKGARGGADVDLLLEAPGEEGFRLLPELGALLGGETAEHVGRAFIQALATRREQVLAEPEIDMPVAAGNLFKALDELGQLGTAAVYFALVLVEIIAQVLIETRQLLEEERLAAGSQELVEELHHFRGGPGPVAPA